MATREGSPAGSWRSSFSPKRASFHPGAPDHGYGRAGAVTTGPRLTVVSALRGPWEVRLVRVSAPCPFPLAPKGCCAISRCEL